MEASVLRSDFELVGLSGGIDDGLSNLLRADDVAERQPFARRWTCRTTRSSLDVSMGTTS